MPRRALGFGGSGSSSEKLGERMGEGVGEGAGDETIFFGGAVVITTGVRVLNPRPCGTIGPLRTCVARLLGSNGGATGLQQLATNAV